MYFPLYVFLENKGIMVQTLREKQKYQITNVGVEKIRLSQWRDVQYTRSVTGRQTVFDP